MIFCSDEKSIEGLLFAGVDIASLANNHIANYGYEGIDNTLNLLNGKSIKHCGVDNSDSIISIKGVNLGFSCFNQIGNWQHVSHAEEANITQVLQNLEKTSDLQILMFHWGEEYTSQPTDRQKQLAYFAIDNGADLIIGNHPHWIQPLEIYKNKLILYALGNFIFDQMWSEETKEGIVTKIYLDKNQIHDIELFPIYIENYGQVNFANEEKSQKILNALKKISS
jgi:poly-gamma-glutamate synthesis protein (capsule biosynthesis protein)